MKLIILDTILDSTEAESIAEDCDFKTMEEAAEYYFDGIYYESSWIEGTMPKYHKFIKTIEGGDLYYDYGAQYFFLVKNNEMIEKKI